jgi:hypothetical protein
MKVLNYMAAVALLCGVSAVSYSIGQTSAQSTKDYQAACLLGDICKFAIYNGNTEFEELYEDYLGNIDCDPRVLITREEVEQYSWVY